MTGMLVLVAFVAGACAAKGSEFIALSKSNFLHYPETQRQKLTEYDVSNLLGRVLHVPSISERASEGLPVADMFHGPKVALMLSVEGAADSDVRSLDGIAKVASQSQIYEMDSDAATPGLSTLKILSGGHRTSRVTDNLRSDALKLCASSDEHVSIACGPQFAKLRWDSEARRFISQQLPLEYLTPERLYNASTFWNKLGHVGALFTHSAKFVGKLDGKAVEMDLNQEVVNQFFSELSLYAELPRVLAEDNRFRSGAPNFVYLSLTGLQKIAEKYGRESSEFATASRVLDAAIPAILSEWRAALGDELQEILYVKKTGTRNAIPGAHMAATRRKLLATGTAGLSSRIVYTFNDIGEYQIVLWMSVIGVVIIFAASIALGNMKFKEDDAGLYSSFKATEDYGEMRHGHVHED